MKKKVLFLGMLLTTALMLLAVPIMAQEVNTGKPAATAGDNVKTQAEPLTVTTENKDSYTFTELDFYTWWDQNEHKSQYSDAFNLTLKVNTTGGTEPYSYQWYKDENAYHNNGGDSSEFKPFYGQMSVSIYDTGVYKCVVTDAEGKQAESKTIKVTVNYGPGIYLKGGTSSGSFWGNPHFSIPKDKANEDLTVTACTTMLKPTWIKWYKHTVDWDKNPSAGIVETELTDFRDKDTITLKGGEYDVLEANLANSTQTRGYVSYSVEMGFDEEGRNQKIISDYFNVVEAEGTLEGGLLTSTDDTFAGVTSNPTYKITLPAGENFKVDPGTYTDVIRYDDFGLSFYPYLFMIKFDLVITEATNTNPATMTFKIKGFNRGIGSYAVTPANRKLPENFDMRLEGFGRGSFELSVTTKSGKRIYLPTDKNVGYKFFDDSQTAEKKVPTANLYTINPTQTDYTGQPQKTTVTPKSGAGAVEKVHYYKDGKEIAGEPKDAGTYTVKIDTKANDNYEAAKELELGTFTIKEKASIEQAVAYRTHVQNVGWQPYVTNGTMAGTSNQSLRLEAMNINLQNQKYAGDIEYRTHIQNIGWESEWKKNDVMSGTSNQGLRLEAMQVRLTGEMANHYDVYYRVHAQNFGWLGWAKNGEESGTAGYAYRLEAMQIMLVDKGGAAPSIAPNSQQDKPFVEKYKDNVKADSLIAYQTHVQNVGWQNYAVDGGTAGTSGLSYRLEGMKINLNNPKYSGDIEYRTHIQNIGWENEWKKNDAMSGTSNQGLRLEAMQVRLTGEMANHYDVYYRVHAQNFGWLGWAKNGEQSGTAGYAYRLEAMQIMLLDKGGAAPNITPNLQQDKPFVEKYKDNVNADSLIAYQTHVQNVGWQNYAVDGGTAGTSGLSYRLEGMKINLNNPKYNGDIEYRTHIQNIGWENEWKKNDVMSGTSGQALRLEAMQVKLTGEMANHYDVYYRVHAQNFGWLGWAKNGEESGTAGYGYRLEAMQIVLVDKGGSAPSVAPASNDSRAFIDKNAQPAQPDEPDKPVEPDKSVLDGAVLDTGENVNIAIKQLSGQDINKDNEDFNPNTTIKAILRSDRPAPSGVATKNLSTTSVPVTVWWDASSQTIYWYSQDPKPMLNADSNKIFKGFSKLVSLDVSHFDTSDVTDMGDMFSGSSSLKSLDVSHFDTSKVTNMSRMFADCSALTTLDVSRFDTSKVTDMTAMFGGSLFEGCSGLTALDVSNFDTSNVTSMSYMFGLCSNLTTLDVSNFDTSNVKSMNGMFYMCSGLRTLDVSNFNTSNVKYMDKMFECCGGLTTLDVSNFNTSNVESMSDLFHGCNGLITLDLQGFNTSRVILMFGMFNDCSALKKIYATEEFVISNIGYSGADNMFTDCSALVGGNGTAYDASHTNGEYARIDKPGQPGYFTQK